MARGQSAPAYAFTIPLEQLIDWEKDDDGRFTLAVLHRTVCERGGLGGSRATYVEEFKCWERDSAGNARWQLFRTLPIPLDDKPNPEADLPLAGEGVTSFRQIPILELEAPSGLWVGDLIGGLAREHFQRRSALNSAEADSLCAIPYAKIGSETGSPGGALPAEVQQNPNRGRDPVGEFKGRGWTCIGADDELGFAEPSGRAYEIVDKQLDKLVDEMLRVTRQTKPSSQQNSLVATAQRRQCLRVRRSLALRLCRRCCHSAVRCWIPMMNNRLRAARLRIPGSATPPLAWLDHITTGISVNREQ